MAALCECGARRNHAIHVIALGMPGAHKYRDPSKAGMEGMSAGKREYLSSQEHKESYARAAEDEKCLAGLAGAPGACFGPLTPHHILPRSQAGGQKAAEQYPVIALCAYHNSAVQDDPQCRQWAYRNTFERDGKVYPFLMRARQKREASIES